MTSAARKRARSRRGVRRANGMRGAWVAGRLNGEWGRLGQSSPLENEPTSVSGLPLRRAWGRPVKESER
jgi:hypothetical protein